MRPKGSRFFCFHIQILWNVATSGVGTLLPLKGSTIIRYMLAHIPIYVSVSICPLNIGQVQFLHLGLVDVVFSMRFEFEFSFEFEFILKYGNKRTIKPYVVIHQKKSWFIFVLETTKGIWKFYAMAIFRRPWQIFCHMVSIGLPTYHVTWPCDRKFE